MQRYAVQNNTVHLVYAEASRSLEHQRKHPHPLPLPPPPKPGVFFVAGGRRCGNRVLEAPGEGGAGACGRMLTMARATAAC
jgi:hypothetical protein